MLLCSLNTFKFAVVLINVISINTAKVRIFVISAKQFNNPISKTKTFFAL